MKRKQKTIYTICRPFEIFFEQLEKWAGNMACKFSFCPDCGRNRYTGAPCKNVNENERLTK